jgi:glycosyltransferase involved in cell wall biosynthesis
LSVIICTFNGAETIGRCLTALARQAPPTGAEVIVVADGSVDDTVEIARAHRVTVVRHDVNRGLAAARNTGILAASGEIVAFLDDDCEPAPDWSHRLLAAYDAEAAGVGGPILPHAPPGYMGRFLTRNNPLGALEPELAASDRLMHRLRLYLRRQWRAPAPPRRYAAPALVGANMSFRRAALLEAGLFDPTFTFGADDVELGLRLSRRADGGALIFDPRPCVTHHFRGTLRDTLRRSHSYGIGTARLYRRRTTLLPAVFPLPVALLALGVAGRRRRRLLLLAALAPQAWFPRSARHALRANRPEALLDPYVKVLQETAANLGVARGLLRGDAPDQTPAGESACAARRRRFTRRSATATGAPA